MRKLLRIITLIIIAFVVFKAVQWSYQGLTQKERTSSQQPVFELDKDCRMDADTGGCICRHAKTGERLDVPYSECRERALNPR